MKFQQFEILGEEIYARLKRSAFDEQALPAIAADALSRINLDDDFQLDQLAEFLLTTKIKQQPSLAFSNLPPVVYRCEEFYIEVLIWTDATTAIHQHAFSGAFRVLVGSSLHSIYEFNEHKRVNSQLLLGDVRLKMAEILRTGDVRLIHPGRSGLAHALFHLDRPSVTLVVRSYVEPWALPQYSLAPPSVAYSKELELDAKVRLFGRLLSVARAVNREKAVELLVSKGTLLDFPRLFIVLAENYDILSSDRDWKRFIDAAEGIYGHLVQHLEQQIKAAKRRESIILARNDIKDPDLRFFLALLLNLPSRTWLYRFIGEIFPENVPEDLCCQWLKRLRDQERLSGAFIELAKKANLTTDLFRTRLNAAIPFERGDPRSEAFLRAAVTGRPSDFCKSGEEAIGVESSQTTDAYARLRQMGELEPLFLA